MPGVSVSVQVVSLVLAEQVLDTPVRNVLPSVEALRVAGQQDLNAIASAFGTSVGSPPALSHVDSAECRRSYGLLASS